MAEYIDREQALDAIRRYGTQNGSSLGHHSGAIDCAMLEIEYLKPQDVAPVVHGRWVCGYDEMDYWKCSVCGRESVAVDDLFTPLELEVFYCPNCGAKMDGKEG